MRDVASTSGPMDWGMTREGSVSSSSYPSRAARDHSLLSRFGGDSCGTALMIPSGIPAESLEEATGWSEDLVALPTIKPERRGVNSEATAWRGSLGNHTWPRLCQYPGLKWGWGHQSDG